MNNSPQNAQSLILRSATLRQQAEVVAHAQAIPLPENIEALSPEAAWGALHELRVQQVELEMQNDELRRAQAELAAVKTRYFDLYNLAPVGYCTLSESGRFLEANLTAAALLEVAQDALVNQSISRFILPADQDLYYRHCNLLFNTGASQTCELRLMKSDGTHFWALLEATAASDAAGVPGCRVVMHDITERKRVEAERWSMQKLQSLGSLAGGIAHDFNNMMTGVFGSISLAKDTLTKNHPGYPLLEEAEKSMSRAIGLTKQLLTFAKGGEPIKEDLNLGTLVETVARCNLSGSQVTLAYRQDHDLWLAKADKGQIEQVVANLTINARQAMPKGGRMSVVLENVELADEAILGLRQGKYIQVTMQDEGGGIDPKHLDRIFDPYFTTKQIGNGLGLAVVYSIITKHGGHIGVASTPGQGTIFTFYLPASESPPSAVIKPPAVAGPPRDRPAHVLVMDDEEMIRGIVVNMLNRYGLSVATAAHGQEAIQMYQHAMTAGMPFDVVIMDLTIPGGMGGKEAVQKLLEMDPHVRAIVSSGYADSPVMSHYADYGFKGAVAKPYTQSELHEAVMQVLNGERLAEAGEQAYAS